MSTLNICQVVNHLNIGLLYNKSSISIPDTKANRPIITLLVGKNIVNSAVFDNAANKWVLKLKRIKGKQVYKTAQMISKPGWKYFVALKELKSRLFKNQNIIFVMNTNTGLRLAEEALVSKQGGELLFVVKRA